MKKITISILILISILAFLSFPYLLKDGAKNKLEAIGYSKEQQNEIVKLSKESITYLEHSSYQESILSFLKNKEFQEEHLKDYLNWSIPEMNVEDIIFVVNHNYIHDSYNEATLSLMKEPYYIDQNLERYETLQNTNQTMDPKEVITTINSNVDLGFYQNTEQTDTTKGTLMIVNKHYTLGDYVPPKLVAIDASYGTGYLEEETNSAINKMFTEAAKQQLKFKINSPYRSYATQVSLYNRYVAKDGIKLADTYSARAGFSEHQTGLAADITSKNTDFGSFEQTNEFQWLQEHAHEYGFILRYPKGQEPITGYMYESWHYRYVGIEAATYIKEHQLTFEEYYAYFVK